MSNATTPTTSRSRAGSEDRYENFEYIEPSFECTEEKLKEFEAELAIRLIKLQKKKQHREKTEEIRFKKQAEIDAAEKIMKENEQARKVLEEKERKKKEEAEKERLRIEGISRY